MTLEWIASSHMALIAMLPDVRRLIDLARSLAQASDQHDTAKAHLPPEQPKWIVGAIPTVNNHLGAVDGLVTS